MNIKLNCCIAILFFLCYNNLFSNEDLNINLSSNSNKLIALSSARILNDTLIIKISINNQTDDCLTFQTSYWSLSGLTESIEGVDLSFYLYNNIYFHTGFENNRSGVIDYDFNFINFNNFPLTFNLEHGEKKEILINVLLDTNNKVLNIEKLDSITITINYENSDVFYNLRRIIKYFTKSENSINVYFTSKMNADGHFLYQINPTQKKLSKKENEIIQLCFKRNIKSTCRVLKNNF